MNMVATTGKNLQTDSAVDNAKEAYEISTLSTSSSPGKVTPLFYSSAQRQRTQFPSPSDSFTLHTPRNYGGRKSRYRWVDQLKRWQVEDWYVADVVAKQLMLPLNTFVTIFWEATFPGSASMPSTFRLGMKRMGQWLRDNGTCNASIYVHENPDDAKLNSHLLVHVPKHLRRAFKAKAGDWFQGLDGGVQVDPRNDAHRIARNLGTRLQYMTKGADDITCRFYGGFRARGGQGPIAIKRAGVSEYLRLKFCEVVTGHKPSPSRFLTENTGTRGAA